MFCVAAPLAPADVQATSNSLAFTSLAFTAPSSARQGWPSSWAGPTVHEEISAPTRGQAALPSTGPAYSVPSGASR